MTTPQFLQWITAEVGKHRIGKVVPPQNVILEEARDFLERELREEISDRVLREADIDGQVEAALAKFSLPPLSEDGARAWLAKHETSNWREYGEGLVTAKLRRRRL